jgi:hypothetical protein
MVGPGPLFRWLLSQGLGPQEQRLLGLDGIFVVTAAAALDTGWLERAIGL